MVEMSRIPKTEYYDYDVELEYAEELSRNLRKNVNLIFLKIYLLF